MASFLPACTAQLPTASPTLEGTRGLSGRPSRQLCFLPARGTGDSRDGDSGLPDSSGQGRLSVSGSGQLPGAQHPPAPRCTALPPLPLASRVGHCREACREREGGDADGGLSGTGMGGREAVLWRRGLVPDASGPSRVWDSMTSGPLHVLGSCSPRHSPARLPPASLRARSFRYHSCCPSGRPSSSTTDCSARRSVSHSPARPRRPQPIQGRPAVDCGAKNTCVASDESRGLGSPFAQHLGSWLPFCRVLWGDLEPGGREALLLPCPWQASRQKAEWFSRYPGARWHLGAF